MSGSKMLLRLTTEKKRQKSFGNKISMLLRFVISVMSLVGRGGIILISKTT
jgi:hypothetical protein